MGWLDEEDYDSSKEPLIGRIVVWAIIVLSCLYFAGQIMRWWWIGTH